MTCTIYPSNEEPQFPAQHLPTEIMLTMKSSIAILGLAGGCAGTATKQGLQGLSEVHHRGWNNCNVTCHSPRVVLHPTAGVMHHTTFIAPKLADVTSFFPAGGTYFCNGYA
jgi:hypothetical protein